MKHSDIDWDSIYAQVPEIMGFPKLRLKGGKWYGPYYITGAESSRNDKLVVMRGRKGDGMITVMEQGGDTKTFISWLIEYGGIGKREVFKFLANREHRAYIPVEKLYEGVPKTVERWQYVKSGGGRKVWNNPLYRMLADIYGEEKVTKVFHKYGITDGLRCREKGIVGTRFWYINRNGEILYDKTMFYKEDGHRDKDLHPTRQFKVGDGYSKTCYFGEHLVGKDSRPVMVVESEKSAVICALEFPNWHWVACGGLKCLQRLETIKNHKIYLVPDMDGAEEWSKEGEVWKWWEKMGRIVGSKWDIADAVMYKYAKAKANM